MLQKSLHPDLKKHYLSAAPFAHIVIDNFLDEALAQQAYRDFPNAKDKIWYEYNNPIEKKLICSRLEQFPASHQSIFKFLNSEDFTKSLSAITGIPKLYSDPELHGGGLHCIPRGGKLDVHIDYSIHPKLEMARRLNLILFLNPDWEETWAGCLELWNPEMTECQKKIEPLFNRAVIFSTTDQSYHGHPEAWNGLVERRSLAVYYLSEANESTTKRYRAQFVARPCDPKDEKTEKFRKLRSGLHTGPSMYRLAKDWDQRDED